LRLDRTDEDIDHAMYFIASMAIFSDRGAMRRTAGSAIGEVALIGAAPTTRSGNA